MTSTLWRNGDAVTTTTAHVATMAMAIATATAAVVDAMDGDAVDGEWSRACYDAFVQRRLERGALSIRTRQGYERLRDKYQQRLRFLHDSAPGNDTPTSLPSFVADQHTVGDAEPIRVATVETKTPYARYSDDESDPEEEETNTNPQEIRRGVAHSLSHDPPILVDVSPPTRSTAATAATTSSEREQESDASTLYDLVRVFFDPRIKRLLFETMWPLAHHGGTGGGDDVSSTSTTKKPTLSVRAVPEWQELEQHKYYALMFKTLVWLFPGLPAFEAHTHAERDWTKDCAFDAHGSYGLSFEGFTVSLLDLALACTDGTIEKCVEFFTHMAKRLETSLPVFRVPTTSALPSSTPTDGQDDDADADAEAARRMAHEQLVWRTVPLEQLFPCPVRARPQFFELKTKLSVAPIVIMVLAGNERPLELQLSTSAKLLVRERDHRSSVRRNTMHSGALSHFIEIEKQFLWTFRSFPGRPTLLIVPSALVSKRTLALYACCRLLESHEHSLEPHSDHDCSVDPMLTFFTAVPEPFPLLYGHANSLCGRVDRQSSKLLVIDHRGRAATKFKIVFKTSLIHNTSAAGGAGAAAVVTSLANVDSAGTAQCTSELVGGNRNSSPQAPFPSMASTAHSFIFVVKMTSDVLTNGPQKRKRASTVGAGKGTTKSVDANVPAQWFTTFSGANENKTIYIDTAAAAPGSDVGTTSTNGGEEDATAGVYYVYVFTLHGFYFEAMYEDCDPTTAAAPEPGNQEDDTESPLAMLTSPKARNYPPGSIVHAPEDDDTPAFLLDDWMRGGASDRTSGPAGSGARAGASSVATSATLLRQLLLLRKQRQAHVQAMPPPECIGGSKITSMKMVTAAAGLRAKFLNARAVERRSRFEQNEEALRAKVLAKLVKTEAKKRALRGDFDPIHDDLVKSLEPTATATGEKDGGVELEAKATLLANFFKEMAVYHPTQREMDQAITDQELHGDQQDELLEHFADLFNDDHALHNMLDAEKWLTSEAKETRRQSIMDERVVQRRRSLVELHRQQVPELDGHLSSNHAGDEVDDATQKPRKKSSVSQRASEDYFSTAMLIRDLMQQVADDEKEQNETTTNGTNGTTRSDAGDAERLRQMAISFRFAAAARTQEQQSVGTTGSVDTTQLELLEATRRDEWLTSPHVHAIAGNARLEQQRHGTSRPTLVPTRQHFQEQEGQLPWQPVWQVETERDGSSLQAIDPGSPHLQRRPTTASGALYSPRPPSVSPTGQSGRATSAASQSATLTRLHTRRIRSARAGTITTPSGYSAALAGSSRPVVRTDPLEPEATIDPAIQHVVFHVPRAFLHHHPQSAVDESTHPTATVVASETHKGGDSCGESEAVAKLLERQPLDGGDGKDKDAVVRGSEVATKNATSTTKKKKKKKKITQEEKRFAERVRELLAISPFANAVPPPKRKAPTASKQGATTNGDSV